MVDDARITGSTELIPRATAVEMARIYRENTAQIAAHLSRARELLAELRETFVDSHAFDVGMTYRGRHGHSGRTLGEPDSLLEMLREFKRDAWAALIDRLNIRRMMSSKRQEQMRDVLCYGKERDGLSIDQFPEITPESIFEVLAGYVNSADDFLTESIREEWEHFRMSGEFGNGALKTNAEKWKVSRKVIIGGVERRYGQRFDVSYYSRPHFVALDQIMHLLDGKGFSKEHHGALVSAIMNTSSVSGSTGETEYFRFRLFGNGNIHLEFKRLDLLAQFNCVGAGGTLNDARQLPNPVERPQRPPQARRECAFRECGSNNNQEAIERIRSLYAPKKENCHHG